MEGGGFDEVVDGFGLGEVEAAGEEGAVGEFSGFGEAGSGGEATSEEVVEEDGGAVGGDLDDVLGGVGVGRLEPGDHGFVEDFACVVKDLGEAGLSGGEGVAEFEEGFGDGAGVGAGEAHDADASAAGRGGDGYDGVVREVGHGDFNQSIAIFICDGGGCLFIGFFGVQMVVFCGEVVVFCVVKLVRKQPLFSVTGKEDGSRFAR